MGATWFGGTLQRLGGAALLVAMFLALLPGVASAESLCTDTWSGASEGTWQTASNWSAKHVPSSSDVACIGSGKTVNINGGTNEEAAVVQGEGSIVISAGSLDVVSLEPSRIAHLSVVGGALKGSAEVDVTSSFKAGEDGWLENSGLTVVIGSGATGTVTPEDSTHLTIEAATLKNEGSLTVGKSSAITGSSGAHLINSGTLTANAEPYGSGDGLNASPGAATLKNTGTLRKTEGSGVTVVGFAIVNEGSVSVTSGKFEFTYGATSGELKAGSWTTSGTGSAILFNSYEVPFNLGATVPMSGTIEVERGTVQVGKIEGAAASLTVTALEGSYGHLELSGTSTSTLQNFTLNSGILKGTGTLEVSHSFTGTGYSYLNGTGTLVIKSGATGSITSSSGDEGILLENWTLTNAGTLTVGLEARLQGEKHAVLKNTGTLVVNGEPVAGNHGMMAPEGEATLINSGALKKTAGTGITPIEFGMENLGSIQAETGKLEIYYPLHLVAGSNRYGGSNQSTAPGQVESKCGDPVSCATGNFSETQTDLEVGGRGVGLELTRTYNSQAAAEGTHSAFGYGWTSSFSDHLAIEKESKKATLYQSEGSTVAFTEGTGGSYTAPVWSQDLLSGSSEAGYTLTLADQTKFKFSGSSGRLETVTDRDGNATTLAYNGEGRLETITDPASRKITLAYNGEGLVESVKDPMGHTVKYTYEGGNLKSVTQPAETSLRWQFKYDGSHQMTEMVDGRGGKTVNEYNTAHQVISQKNPAEHTTTFEYEPLQTKITNTSTGSVTDEWFTSNDEPSSITRGYGTTSASTESFTYNAAGQVLTETDGNGHTTEYAYDAAGDRTSLTDPNKHETKWTYDATHDVETTMTPKGETTTIKRESHGNPETISRPAPGATTQTTTYKYSAHGEVESLEDPLKRVWKYGYDSKGDRTSETDPESNKRIWEYNEDSQVTAAVSPRGNATGAKASEFTTKFELDPQGRPLKVTDPLGHTTKYTYDGDGNIETVTDGNSNKTTYTYNGENEPIKVKEANGDVTETACDGAGQIISQTDGNKNVTKYVRNPLEEVTEVKDPLGRVTKKEYDAAGNVKAVTDPLKRTTTYTYDPANRLTEVSYSDGKTPTAKYEYDADGDRTKIVDGTGTTNYTYDELDRMTESKDGHGDVIKYEYDLANEQTKITYPNTKVITRAYDKDGRLEKVTDWSSDITKFTYDPDSDLTATVFPSETKDEDKYAYSDADQMSEVKMLKGAETLASLLYTRDNNGQVKTTTVKGLPGEEKPENTYDSNSRLTKGGATAYEYDAANNATKIATGTYKYDKADELESGPSLTYSYNEAGERTKTTPSTGPATSYGYDQAGNLASVSRPEEGTTPKIEDSYAYDGNGLRTSQTSAATTNYLTWNMSEVLPTVLSDGTNSYVYGPGGVPIEQINSGGTVEYLHHDQAGSTRLLTGSAGTVAGKCTYSAYGAPTCEGTATTPLGYDAQYTNSDTGLIYLRAREYDPSTGQFLTVDPLEAITGEPYSYAGDNPVNHGDPTGLVFGIPGTPSWEEVGEAVAGWGDTITFGGTKWVREQIGDENVDTCSGAYRAGGDAGLVTGVVVPGEDEVEAAELAETGAKDLSEQLTLEEAEAGAGSRIMEGKINDPEYPEDVWAKMHHEHINPDGTKTTVHYWENLETGFREGFKFK